MPADRDQTRSRRTGGLAAVVLLLSFFVLSSPRGVADDEAEPVLELPITRTERLHWAWEPLSRPSIPDVPPAWQHWTRNPIDVFIAERLAAQGFAPPLAAPGTGLVRRLSLNLTGLPLQEAAVAARGELSSESPDAYVQLVDQLLARPAYGEHWAQYWLDLARFAETDGFEHDKIRPHAWKYRDWVIASFNRDLPYDRFVQLQIAGDKLAPDDPQARIATAFCLSGPDMPDINSQQERRHVLLNEMTSTVGAVFLGLQVGCAQCHDHKFDPISQADFYRLRAFFEPAIRLKRDQQIDFMEDRSTEPVVARLMLRGDWRRPGPELQPQVPRIARVATHTDPQPKENGETDDESMDRVDLAEWLTRDDNSLAARVIVNRLWQYHFGQGLSTSPSDFGVMGSDPSHPELLDWLASELIAGRWSVKHLQRLIVTSATFRQTGAPDRERLERGRAVDPENRLLWSFPRRRLSGEVIRDSMLAASDSLLRDRGGPGVRPPLPDALRGTLLRGQWEVTSDKQAHLRRSVYVFARRNLRFPAFDVFDRPDANASCPRRSPSTTATQSLYLFNSRFALQSARRLAGYVARQAPRQLEPQIELVYHRLLQRAPDEAERQQAADFVRQQTEWLRDEDRRPGELALPLGVDGELASGQSGDAYQAAALVDFCLAVMNSNEFVFLE